MTGLDEIPEGADDPVWELERYIRSRTHRQAAGDVGELDCFRGGVLRSLKNIASGNGSWEDQERLRDHLAATERGVNEIVERLRAIRDKLAGQSDGVEFARRIDDLVEGSFAKIGIREQIGEVIRTDLRKSSHATLAQGVCNEINGFNRAVIDLGRQAKKTSHKAKPQTPHEIVEHYLTYTLEDLYKGIGGYADKFLTGADREDYVLGVPDMRERGERIVEAYRREICERQTRFDLEVSAELAGGPVLEPVQWLHTVTGYMLGFRIFNGMTIDAVDAVVMTLGRMCDWNLYTLCDD
jgi:hypothetical protein